MSKDNGVVRISRKGKRKFAFGEEGQPFEIDVVSVFQHWIEIDEGFRNEERGITDVASYHQAAVDFAKSLTTDETQPQKQPQEITTGEALDFLARLREVYDDVAAFFRPRSREERGLPDTSGAGSTNTSAKTEMQFTAEEP